MYCLMNADFEHRAREPESEWSIFYAKEMVDRYALPDDPDDDKLALYYFPSCPFCQLVLRAIESCGVDVELRDIFERAEYRDELVGARGRATVPVLRITTPKGDDRWMPESRDIVSYLQEVYA